MTRFADPTRCPDCGGPLQPRAARCQVCGLPLSGELPGELFATLRQADAILVQLRQAAISPSAAPAPTAPGSPQAPFVGPSFPSYPVHSQPAPTPAARPATGLSSATVPRILLGLGALCLVVAALIFLAVTWSALGMAGRTAILLALTAAAFGGAQSFARKPLPAATESFTVVGLAFAALSLAGAANAGWLPEMGGGLFTAAQGALLLVLGAATAEAARRVPGTLLYSGELALGLGAVLVVLGAVLAAPGHFEVVLVVATLVAAGTAAICRRPLNPLRRVLFLVLAATCWLALALGGLVRAALHRGLDGLWAHGNVWPLLAAALLAAAVVAITRAPLATRVGAATVAATLAWIALWLPISALDSATAAVAAAMVPLLLAAAATHLTPAPWRVAAAVPLALSAAVPAITALVLAATAVSRVESFTPWTASFGAHFPAANPPVSALLLVPLVLSLLIAASAAARLVLDRLPRLSRGAVPITAGLALFAIATIAHDPVPVALVVGLTLCVGIGVAAWSLLGDHERWLWLAAAILALALWLSSPGVWFTAITLSVIAALAATVALRTRNTGLRTAGDAILPLALAGALWLLADIAGLVPGARALIILVVLAALAIGRPRPAGEIASTCAVFLAITVAAAQTAFASAHSGQSALTWLAINLTVCGALVGVHSLVTANRPRRWLAGTILLLATWIRLGEIGVTAPEAYTLPAALVLLAVGLWALRSRPHERTHRALAAGLLLALVPSLLWSFADPVSLRALLLGLACVALVLAGAQFSWGAPLVYGAAVGAVLVLREAAPWAAQVNPWIVTGVIGLLLTAVGITWEQRLQELNRSRGYLARLR
ncbi:SCO7613 C-terminal domain-containing membrane protein [Tomitella biformata]|uniref:SCO7613 C-terminal domain-containing membrane protein n=1 Tax=Tomitella biformata TaxID=630403 RepID=UPI000464FA9A|nr:hypothetical protein [Tomitella biformata]